MLGSVTRRHALAVVLLLGCGPSVAAVDGSEGADSSTTLASTSTTTIGSGTATGAETSSTATSAADAASDADESDAGGVFDVGARPDLPPPGPCRFPTQPRSQELGQLWIAANTLGTVSKIDVATGVELGAYLTDPEGNGDPVGVSVGLSGDAVVAGEDGVTMIRGDVDTCADPSNTSTGATDLRPWPDGCVAWHTPYSLAHAVAWTAGTPDAETCTHVDAKIWVGASHPTHVLLLDGETGTIEDSIDLLSAADPFIDSAAVDSAGNLWLAMVSYEGALFRVDASAHTVESWPWPDLVWGVAVDREDRPFVCGPTLGRFDYATQSFDQLDPDQGFGCGVGYDDVLWLAEDPVLGVDSDALSVTSTLDMPGNVYSIAADFEGSLWGVAGDQLLRIDPSDGSYDAFERPSQSSTEGDFTGFGLALTSGYI
jgi:hypothetical protein